MTQAARPYSRRIGLVVVATLMALGFAGIHASQSSAQVTAVTGSAFGVSAPDITLGGGAQPAYGPTPTVSLPSGGSATAVTASDASEDVVYGPATMFQSGPVNVSTQGTPAGGSVTSSSTINAISTANGGTLSADSIASTCTANGTNTGSTTITNGVVDTNTNSSGTVTQTAPVPTNPTVGYTINGKTQISATDTETFTWVFNQQITNADGSLTVIAAEETLNGPFAKGHIILGESTCGITGSQTTTTGLGTSTTTGLGTSTTTGLGTSTTTGLGTSTTTGRPQNFLCQILETVLRFLPIRALRMVIRVLLRVFDCTGRSQ